MTGDREVTTVLTVDARGGWALEKGTLHDVTHLPCRSARYTPLPAAAAAAEEAEGAAGGTESCAAAASAGEPPQAGTPAGARKGDFPVAPGATMPDVAGCARQDYWVLFVVAIEEPAGEPAGE